MSADTLVKEPESPQTLNRYAYTHNNPVIRTDPDGHCAFIYRGLFIVGIDNFDCTVDQIDKWTAEERIAFIDLLATTYGLGDSFEGIKGVIKYFEDSAVINFTPGQSWASLADAYTLAAIQDGARLWQGKKPINFTNGADRLWMDFIQKYKASSQGLDDPAVARAWALAEQRAVDWGIARADLLRGRPGGEEGFIIEEFIAATNLFRTQLKDYGVIRGLFDPRDYAAAYNRAMWGEAYNRLQWALGLAMPGQRKRHSY